MQTLQTCLGVVQTSFRGEASPGPKKNKGLVTPLLHPAATPTPTDPLQTLQHKCGVDVAGPLPHGVAEASLHDPIVKGLCELLQYIPNLLSRFCKVCMALAATAGCGDRGV